MWTQGTPGLSSSFPPFPQFLVSLVQLPHNNLTFRQKHEKGKKKRLPRYITRQYVKIFITAVFQSTNDAGWFLAVEEPRLPGTILTNKNAAKP